MKRHSKKTDLSADRWLQKEGNTPRNPQRRAGKISSPHRAIPAIVENVENLEFIRKPMWKNIEARIFGSLKTVSRQAIDQAIKHAHGFQHASEQAFFPFLMAPSGYFSLECTTDLVFSEPCSKILSPVEKSRRNRSEQPGISTISKTFAPLFFTLIRVFIPAFNNL